MRTIYCIPLLEVCYNNNNSNDDINDDVGNNGDW